MGGQHAALTAPPPPVKDPLPIAHGLSEPGTCLDGSRKCRCTGALNPKPADRGESLYRPIKSINTYVSDIFAEEDTKHTFSNSLILLHLIEQ